MIPLAPDLWIVDGPVVTGAAGFAFPTRMAVVRLPGEGGLWIWSPVAPEADLLRAVTALGPVRHLIAPNALHHLSLARWAEAFPEARVNAAPGLTPSVAGTTLDATLGDRADAAWEGVIDQVVLRGNRITTEVVFHHRPSGTVLITDWVQHIPAGFYSGWRALVARLDLMSAPAPEVPRKFRLATTDRAAARRGVERMLAWEGPNLVMAHGAPVLGAGDAALRRAFRWLMT